MAEAGLDESVSTTTQVERTPQGRLKRWLSELALAEQNEKDWKTEADRIWTLYQSKKAAANSFNILWSNTETLRPALYNSSPRPDVRRRFKDPDPVGKVAANVQERTLTYLIDAYDFDQTIKMVILDVLLPGRGVGRIKYVPKFRPLSSVDGLDEATPADGDAWLDGPVDTKEVPPAEEELYDESAECVHVQWDDYRHGPGKEWDEVPWDAFRHRMPYDQLCEQFGVEKAKKFKLADVSDTMRVSDKNMRSLLKVAEVWEIWDKSKRRVLFISDAYKDGPVLEIDDPLKLDGFRPLPRPIYAIEDGTSLIPAPLYVKYEQQAQELNRTTTRINKIVNALKVRGAYSASLGEVAKIIEADDNEMLPIENVSEIANMGGLDKAIWLMPIDKLGAVLESLYVAREKTIQTIYEITGLGDIMRGVSNPHETLGAQQLKSQWGSLRLQRLQREVQRFIRDLLRLKAEIVAEHFQMETLQAITGIQLPTAEDKAKIQQLAASPAAQQAPPEAQAMAEKILATPTWVEVMTLLKSDSMRQYRIDIETDSTVQETLTRDAQGMQEAIAAVVNLMTGVGPAVEKGVLSIDVVKGLASAMARTSRMGQAVEDAVEQMQQPPPPTPEQAPPDFSKEVAQIKAQSDQQIAQLKVQNEQAKEAAKQQHEQALAGFETQKTQYQAAADAHATQMDAAQKASIAAAQEETKRQVSAAQEETKRQIAQAQCQMDCNVAAAQDAAKAAREEAALQAKGEQQKESDLLKAAVAIITAQISATKSVDDKAGPIADEEYAQQEAATGRKSIMDLLEKMHAAAMAPKKVDFQTDADGNVVGATSTTVTGD